MKNAAKRPQTMNEGATRERSCWLAFIRRLEREGLDGPATIERLKEYGAGRTRRDNRKAGGLGRK